MTSTRWQGERARLQRVCVRLVRAGLVTGSSGNVSMRLRHGGGDLVLITPRGADLEELAPSQLAIIDMEGEPVEEELPPSSESALHLAVYLGRPDVGAVVHTHPVFSSVAAVAGREIPPLLDEVIIKIGGGVRVAEHAFPGTEELAANALHALGDRMAALLRNHGLLTVGKSPETALENSLLVERLAQVFLYTSLTGGANPLPAEAASVEKELYMMQRAAERETGDPEV